MNVVGGRLRGEEQQVGVSSVEVAMQTFGDRLQVHVLDTPHLQPRLLPRTLKLLMGHHDDSERKGEVDHEKERDKEEEKYSRGGRGKEVQKDVKRAEKQEAGIFKCVFLEQIQFFSQNICK